MADKKTEDQPKTEFPGYYLINDRKVRPDGTSFEGGDAIETPEQVRIRELEAQILALQTQQDQLEVQAKAAEEQAKQNPPQDMPKPASPKPATPK